MIAQILGRASAEPGVVALGGGLHAGRSLRPLLKAVPRTYENESKVWGGRIDFP